MYYGWIIVATLFVVNFATHATGTLNLGLFIIPMGDEMEISRGLFGWLTTARYLTGGISALVLGRLLDRFGPRLLIPISALVTGLCVISIGFANHVALVFLLFAVIGLAGLSTPGGGLLSSVPVAKWFVRRRGTAIAMASLGLGLGGVTFLPLTQVFIDGVGWRDAWLYLGIISMVLIIPVSLVFLRRQPEDMGLLLDGDTENPPADNSDRPTREPEVVWSIKEALATRAFWMLTAAMVLSGFAMGGSVHRIPYWVELVDDADLVSLSFSADAAGATTMMLLAGFFMDRFPARFVAAGAFAGFLVAVTVMLLATSAVHMFISVIIFGLAVGANIVSQTYLWASYYGRTFLGAIRGITLPTIQLASAFGAPVVGYFFDFTGGYEPAWLMLIGIYAVAFLIMVAAKPPVKTVEPDSSGGTG